MQVLHKNQLRRNRCEYNLKREIEIQMNLRHPNILCLYRWFWDDRKIYLVLEFAPGGELFKVGESPNVLLSNSMRNVFKHFSVTNMECTSLSASAHEYQV